MPASLVSARGAWAMLLIACPWSDHGLRWQRTVCHVRAAQCLCDQVGDPAGALVSPLASVWHALECGMLTRIWQQSAIVKLSLQCAQRATLTPHDDAEAAAEAAAETAAETLALRCLFTARRGQARSTCTSCFTLIGFEMSARAHEYRHGELADESKRQAEHRQRDDQGRSSKARGEQ